MARHTVTISPELNDYITSVSVREPEVLTRLREETASHPMAQYQIAAEQGQLLAFLVKLIGAKRTLELGVFCGYSSLWVALALPADGQIIACDISEELTNVARRHWDAAGVADKIDLRIAPALETLTKLLEDGQADSFDFAFIDADKTLYDEYYENTLALIRPGGLIAIDNVLRHGSVVDADTGNADTRVIQKLNRKIHADTRVDLSLLPIGDGVTLVRKR